MGGKGREERGVFWSDLKLLPAPSTADTAWMWLNVVPILVSGGWRALFWLLHIPMASWNWSLRKDFWWSAEYGDQKHQKNLGEIPSSAVKMEKIVAELEARKAHRFPHTGVRPFPHHISGVAGILVHWQQPDYLCLAALFHSVYATELYPWGLYQLTERATVRDLIGANAEEVVYLYCTCSQTKLFASIRALADAGCALPPDGFPVFNYYTGETQHVPVKLLCGVLLILGADIMEQDPFFDTCLAFAALKLGAAHSDNPPALVSMLEQAGYFAMSNKEVGRLHSEAKSALKSALRISANHAGLEKTVQDLREMESQAPWLYEIGCERLRLEGLMHRGGGGGGGGREGEALMGWQEAWGTRWRDVCDAEEARAYVEGIVGKRD